MAATLVQQKINERNKICNKCPHKTRKYGNPICAKCGCPLSNKIRGGHCPDGRFKKVNSMKDGEKI